MKKRGLSVGPVWVTLGRFRGQACKKRALTMAHMCTTSHLVSKDDFVWVSARKQSHADCSCCGGQNKSKGHVVCGHHAARQRPRRLSGFLGDVLDLRTLAILFWKRSSWLATRPSQEVRCGRSKA